MWRNKLRQWVEEESQSSGDVGTGRWATQGRKSELGRCVDREVGYTRKKVRAQEMCGQGGGLHKEESQSSGDVWTGRWATQGRKSELRRCVDREVGYTGKKVRAQELCGQGGGPWLSFPIPFLPRRGRKAP